MGKRSSFERRAAPPPVSLSVPRPPVRTLALPSPIRVSAKADPVMLSMLDSTSPSASPVPTWAVARLRLTVTPAAEVA